MAAAGSSSSTGPQVKAFDALKVVISGYYGYDNLGDEAILVALVDQLRAAAPGIAITALSGNPAQTAADLGVQAVHRLQIPAIWRALRQADLFISGGGSLLQDVTGLGSVPYYLGLMQLARLAGTRTMMLGQGVGPLNLPSSRLLVGAAVKRLDAVTVRDADSQALLARCGVPASHITLTADPVLALDPAPDAAIDALWAKIGLIAGRPTLAVSVRPWSAWYERQLKAFSAVIAQCATDWDAQVLLLPFHRPDDEPLLEEVRACLETRPEAHRPSVIVLEEHLSPRKMTGLLSRVDLLFGMRLHALIMAAAVETPAVALIYDPKIAAFAKLADYPTIESVTALENSDQLAATMQAAWEDRLAASDRLAAKRLAWQAAARRNAEVAIALAAGI